MSKNGSIWQLFGSITWIHCSQMLYFLEFLSTAIEPPKVAKWTPFLPLKSDQKRYKQGEKGKVAKSTRVYPPLPCPFDVTSEYLHDSPRTSDIFFVRVAMPAEACRQISWWDLIWNLNSLMEKSGEFWGKTLSRERIKRTGRISGQNIGEHFGQIFGNFISNFKSLLPRKLCSSEEQCQFFGIQ